MDLDESLSELSAGRAFALQEPRTHSKGIYERKKRQRRKSLDSTTETNFGRHVRTLYEDIRGTLELSRPEVLFDS